MGKKVLKGNRNQCSGCNEYFNSTGAFEKHRTGHHGVDRRCMTADEMKAAGMILRPDGFWIGSEMKEYWNENKTSSDGAETVEQ